MTKILSEDYHMTFDSLHSMPAKEYEDIALKVGREVVKDLLDELEMHHIWFTINERYGRYTLTLFYDNEYNNSHGEDL